MGNEKEVSREELIAALESTWNALDMVINPDKEINQGFNTDGIARETLKLTSDLLNRVHAGGNEMNIKRCKKCGAVLSVNEKICWNCTHPMDDPNAT